MESFKPPILQAAQGSSLKDMDLVKWVEKKLGDSDGWAGRANAALLSKEMLEELETCFQALDSQTKLKFIISIPHMNPRNLSAWKSAIVTLLDLACRDADDWVETIADMYRDFPSTGVIAPKLSNKESHFSRTLDELKKCFRKHCKKGNLRMTPMSHMITSASVNKAGFGVHEDDRKHFSLRKKPKSYNLLKELEKQCDAMANINKQKNGGVVSSTVPIKMRSTLRKGNNDLPMRGIPTTNTCKLNAGFTNEPKKFQRHLVKREGGAKLLDICDLPQSLKKRKQAANEEEKKRKMEEKEFARRKVIEEKKEKEEARRIAQQRAQEEAKKLAEQVKTDEKDQKKEERYIKRQFSDAVPSTLHGQSTYPTSQLPTQQTTTNVKLAMQQRSLPANAQCSQQVFVRQTSQIMHPRSHQLVQRPNVNQSGMLAQSNSQYEPNVFSNQSYLNVQLAPTRHREQEEAAAQKAREEAILSQCNEMLRNANSLDHNGRQMVMDFMTGNKCNPRPELGNIITMKLSETIEDGLADNQMCKMKVETFFQMDYSNGEWKRLRKCRLLQLHELAALGTQLTFMPYSADNYQQY